MADHFSLDIHPHQLRAAAHSLDTIRENLAQHAKTATNEPGAIGQKWTGYAATSVTSEMTAVGGHLSTFATQLLHCSNALTTLAGHYEKAQATLVDLNTKWAKSETDYTSACADADASYDKTVKKLRDDNGGKPPNRGITSDLDDSRSYAKSQAYQAQQKTQGALETDFTTLKQHLTTQTTTCGTTLSANIPVKNLGVCTADNPTGLDHGNLLADLGLASALEDMEKAAAQVKADAQADADAMKSWDPNSNDLPASVLAHMKAHAGDSAYATALLNDLGASGQALLLSWAQFPDVDNSSTWQDAVDARQKQLGELWAAASKNMTFDEDYLNGLQDALEKQMGGPLGPEHGAGQMFIPLMKYGPWDEQDLLTMTDAMMSGDMMRKHWATAAYQVTPDLYEALANNPVAAADAFAKYHQEMYDAMFSQSPEVADAVVKTLQSATIDSRADFPGQPNPAEDNAQWLIQHAGKDTDWPWDDNDRKLFANLVTEYRDDLAYTVGSPLDPGQVNDPDRAGVNVSTQDWINFLKIPMAENETMVQVAAAFQNIVDASEDAYVDAMKRDKGNGFESGSVVNAHGWDYYTHGVLQSIFVHVYNEVAQDRKDDAESQKDAVDGLIDSLWSAGSDPEGFVKDLGADALKSFVGSMITKGIHPEKLPPVPDGMDTMQSYADDAVAMWKHGALRDYPSGGVKYTGSPQDYVTSSMDDFTQYIHGEDVDYAALKKDPAAWKAFNNWLHDPAVTYTVFPGWAAEHLGASVAGNGHY